MKYAITEDELKADRKEYQKWRSDKIGSSDVSVIMGNSPWKTPLQLWKSKTGRVVNEFAPSLNAQLGIIYEDTVRSEIEFKLDLDFPPQIFVSDLHPFMMSSLDGWNEENKIVLEIKSVLGRPTYDKALEGKVSETYLDQVQHQLYVTGGTKCLFYVAKIEPFMGKYKLVDKVLVEAYPDKDHQEKIVKSCLEFYNCMKNDIPPALTNRDAFELPEGKFKDELLKYPSASASEKKNLKLKILELCKETADHNFYELGTLAKLKEREDGAWVLTMSKA